MPVRYLILSLTNRCNLSCRYCYNADMRGSEEMSETVIDAALAMATAQTAPFHLQLTGGEPTLVPDKIHYLLNQVQALSHCSSIAIQTNATQLNPELLALFRQHQVQVGVSLDGPPNIQQQQRGKAAETYRGLQQLEAAQVPFRVTAVVSADNVATLPQLALSLAGFSFARGIALDLLVDKANAQHNAVQPASPTQLAEAMPKLLDTLRMVNSRRLMPLRLRELDSLQQSRSDGCYCHACNGESMAVAASGNIYPCGQTLGDPQFQLGNVFTAELQPLATLQQLTLANQNCSGCELQGRCPGECPSRLFYNPTQQRQLSCDLYLALSPELI